MYWFGYRGRDTGHPTPAALRPELHTLGYVEGGNLALENRFAHGRFELLSALAAELVRL